MEILKTDETTKITIPLDDATRDILTQDNIENKKNEITRIILYNLFRKTGKVGELLEELLTKGHLEITNHRTVKVRTAGIDGEVNMHFDGSSFPGGKNRNIIIPWGLGTESYTLNLSRFFKHVDDEMNKYIKYRNAKELEDSIALLGLKLTILKNKNISQKFFEKKAEKIDLKLFEKLHNTFIKKVQNPPEFKEYIQDIISKHTQSYKGIKSNSRIHKKSRASSYTKTISKKKILSNFNFTEKIYSDIINYAYKKYKINNEDFEILISEAPNQEGDITALIISGVDVLHRRMSETKIFGDRWIELFKLKNQDQPKTDNPSKWRYLLNIYYHTDDIPDPKI